jgi:branched-chain amino acid transport system permease protein
MLGGYTAYWAFTILGIPPLVSMFAAGASAAAIGAAGYRLLFRRLLRPGAAGARIESNSLLLFFGVSIMVQNAVALFASATPRGYEYLSSIRHLGPVAMTGNRLAALACALAVLLAVGAFLRWHSFGLSIRALIEHREAARVVGVAIERVEAASFAIGFGTAAMAGTLLSMTEQVSPFMGFPFTIAAFVVVILGGLGYVAGGVAAAFLFGALETYGVALTSSTYRSILLYGIFVLVRLVRPQGLFGRSAAVR